MGDFRNMLAGHAWTVFPTVRNLVKPVEFPAAHRWTREVATDVGSVTVWGEHRAREGETLVVVIHGLGGSPESSYMAPIAVEAERRGWGCVRLALRGAEGLGGDFYHAGLTADLHALLAAPAFEHYSQIYLVGFSLGGHISLRATTEPELDARVAAVAAVCPPIDLAAGIAVLDHPSRFVYRQWILQGLVTDYARIAAQRPVQTPVSRVKQARTIREYDALTVVPRFGFGNVDNYYATQSISTNIEQVARPALMVHSRHDPMIPPHTIDPVLGRAPDLFIPHWVHGAGHVFFPADVDLGVDAPRGLGPQVLGWLAAA